MDIIAFLPMGMMDILRIRMRMAIDHTYLTLLQRIIVILKKRMLMMILLVEIVDIRELTGTIYSVEISVAHIVEGEDIKSCLGLTMVPLSL